MTNKHCFTILLGGTVTPTARLAAQVAGTRVIAADSGMSHAAVLGLEPELWVGDFDSAAAGLFSVYANVARETYPAAKATTDGAIAIEAALARGARSIILVGAMGGRFDHALSHSLQVLELAARGILAFASSGHEEMYPLLSQLVLPDLKSGTRLSVLGLSELEGLSIEGVRWPLENRQVHFGSTLTISNESNGPVLFLLQEGTALVIVHPYTDEKI